MNCSPFRYYRARPCRERPAPPAGIVSFRLGRPSSTSCKTPLLLGFRSTMPQAVPLQNTRVGHKTARNACPAGKTMISLLDYSTCNSELVSHGIKKSTRGSQVRGKVPEGRSARQSGRAASHRHPQAPGAGTFESHELPKKQADAMLSEMVGLVTKHLKKGDKIRLTRRVGSASALPHGPQPGHRRGDQDQGGARRLLSA